MEDRGQLSPCKSRGLNSSPQAWRQAPLLAEPSPRFHTGLFIYVCLLCVVEVIPETTLKSPKTSASGRGGSERTSSEIAPGFHLHKHHPPPNKSTGPAPGVPGKALLLRTHTRWQSRLTYYGEEASDQHIWQVGLPSFQSLPLYSRSLPCGPARGFFQMMEGMDLAQQSEAAGC